MATVEKTVTASIETIADLVHYLGDLPLDRIRLHPPLGQATVQDVIAVKEKEDKLCELVEGILLEKTVGYTESWLAGFLLTALNNFVLPRDLGLVTGADGPVELSPNLVRIPDVAFIRWDRFPGGCFPLKPIPPLVPNLAIEVLSRSNTPGEMGLKRQNYFQTGVQLVWEVDPSNRTVAVFSSPDQFIVLGIGDALDGGTVLPGFTLPLQDLFAKLDR